MLRRFPKNEKFGLERCQALSLQQQVAEIFISSPKTKEGFDVAVDRFHYSESHWHPTVAQNSFQVSEQHLGQLFEGLQSLPMELIELSLRR
jgi:hypothetical protein